MSVEGWLNRSGETGPVANAAGWQALCDFVETVPLEECRWLDHLTTYGVAAELGAFEAELVALSRRDDLPEGVGDVLSALLAAVRLRERGDTQFEITDGVE